MKEYLSILVALGLSAPAWAASAGIENLKGSISSYHQAYQEKNWAIAENHINYAAKILRDADSSGDAEFYLAPEYQSVRLQAESSLRQFHGTMAAKAYQEANEAVKQLKTSPDSALREAAQKACQEGIRRINLLKRYGFAIDVEMTSPTGVKIQGGTVLDFCQEQLKALKSNAPT